MVVSNYSMHVVVRRGKDYLLVSFQDYLSLSHTENMIVVEILLAIPFLSIIDAAQCHIGDFPVVFVPSGGNFMGC